MLTRVALGHARRRPLQSALLVMGVALGVAVVVAIDMANSSALAAFRLSTETVTGRATHRVVGGPRGIDEDVYTQIRVDLGLRSSAPVVEATARVQGLGGRALTLLGIDPFAEPPFRNFLTGGETVTVEGLAALLGQADSVLLGREVADEMALRPGDSFTIDVGAGPHDVTLIGVLEPDDELGRRALETLVLADISTAQELLGFEGRLSRIDLLLPAHVAGRQAALDRVADSLPPYAIVVPASDQQVTVEAMTDAFELNLTALSLLALMVGTFLILNTMRFSVVQRRTTLATLRALGVTRREIFALVVAEAAILGALGTAIGLLLGIVLARGAVSLVTQTINDLYFLVTVREIVLLPQTIAKGAAMGLTAALGAALWPAWEATAVAPVTALRRSAIEAAASKAAPRALAFGLVLVASGLLLLAIPGDNVLLGLASLALVILGFALAAPLATLVVMRAVGPALGVIWGPVGRMAPRGVDRALSRTAVAIAALMLAVCVSIGIGLMVSSFRVTVVRWLQDTLQADVFVSRSAIAAGAPGSGLDPNLTADLASLKGVARSATARSVVVRSPEHGPVSVVALSDDIAGESRWYVDAIGPHDVVWSALDGGAVMISEPLAHRLELAVGDTFSLLADGGTVNFPIVAVVRDFSTDRGLVIMSSGTYSSQWSDDTVSSLALILDPGQDADAFAEALRSNTPDSEALRISSNRGLRDDVLTVFDRAFAVTRALQLLAVVVAFIGVLAALMALQMERSREFATLRACGMTGRQLAGLSLLETGLMGLVAGLLSWPAGLTLALILIRVINRRSFGWTIDTTIEAAPFLGALGVAVVAALLAGVYPALRLRSVPIARALREE